MEPNNVVKAHEEMQGFVNALQDKLTSLGNTAVYLSAYPAFGPLHWIVEFKQGSLVIDRYEVEFIEVDGVLSKQWLRILEIPV